MKKHNRGYTLIEVIIVMSIFILLTGLTTISLLNAKHKSSLSASVDTFIADLKQQQLKAMLGDTEGRISSGNYGIFFAGGTYTLFHDDYSSTDSANFDLSLGDNIEFSNITFPGSQIIFFQGSGEIGNYTEGSNTIIIKDILDNNQKTLTINEYGVVEQIN
ncbi:type II secretion system GspH family protein [Patescibacteria group bacterium]|nr:type II secretion system GspH family protein [Patescibacteria group bacterium]